MCLLMVTMGALPKREYLVNASINNPDGYGFAVRHDDRIVTGRSMKYDKLIDRFYEEMGKSNNPIGMFHARYTTHGKTMLENNHPFRVDGRKDIVLAHNGMLPITPRDGDERSDTRIFAEDILGSIGVQELDDRDTFDKLETFTAGSKIAILSTSPELRDPVYILNETLGHWEGDIWWSNSGYRYSYPTYSYGGKYGSGYALWNKDYKAVDEGIIGRHWWEEEESTVIGENRVEWVSEEPCYVCGAALTESDYHDGICDTCNSCLDCYEHAVSCMCYNPTKIHSSRNLIKYY